MVKSDVAKILAVIAAAYPRFEVNELTVQVWHEMLKDIEYSIAQLAIKKLILESTFPPAIAEVRKAVVSITTPGVASGVEAWGEVTKAIKNYGFYRQEDALASMSETTAKVVRYIGWQDICMAEEAGVIRGQFLKMYEQLASKENTTKLLPVEMQEQIIMLSEKMDLKVIEGGLKNAK